MEIVYDFTYGDGLVIAGNDNRCVCIVQDECPHNLLRVVSIPAVRCLYLIWGTFPDLHRWVSCRL